MRPEDWLAAFRLRRLTVVNCLAVCLIAAALITLFQPRQYRSEGWLYAVVTSRQITAADLYRGSLVAQQRALTYQALATSPLVLDPVIATLGLDTTAEELASRMEVTNLEGSASFELAVTDTSASRAKSIVDAVSAQLATTVASLEKVGTISPVELRVQSPGSIATSPESPNVLRNLGIGAAVGLTLAGAAVALTAGSIALRRRQRQAFWVYVSDGEKEALMLARLHSPDRLVGVADDEAVRIDPLMTTESSANVFAARPDRQTLS